MSATLLVFARAPEAGRVKTRLVPEVGADAAARLHTAFVDDVCRLTRDLVERRDLAIAGAVDHPALLALAARERMTVRPQVGDDLGARMANAIAGALADGAERAIIVGGDSPMLPRGHLARAIAALDHADVVVGPAEDGGYWMIGARRPCPSLFAGIAWGEATVMAATLARLAASGLRHALADRFWDIDSPADLARLRDLLAVDRSPSLAPATRAAIDALYGIVPGS